MMSNAKSPASKADGPNRALIGGAGVLALLSASCCVLPIALSIVGLGGSWLALLGPFVAYRVEILIAVGVVLAWGWIRLWRRWRCARARASTVVLLGLATLAFGLAATSPLWEDGATRVMLALWRSS